MQKSKEYKDYLAQNLVVLTNMENLTSMLMEPFKTTTHLGRKELGTLFLQMIRKLFFRVIIIPPEVMISSCTPLI